MDTYFLYVDSHDRISGTHSDFTYNVSYPPDKQYTHCVVLSANIPKSYYLVPKNQSFTLIEGVSSVKITVPEGDYLLNTFRLVIQNLLNQNSPNGYLYTVSYPTITTQANTGKFTYSVSGNGTTQPIFSFTDQIYEIMGFNKNSQNRFINNTITSTNVVKLQVKDKIHINTDIIEGDNNGFSVLQEINATSNVDFSTINYQATAPEYYIKKLRSSKINSARFSITDEHSSILELNGLNSVFCICFFRASDFEEKARDFMKLYLLKQK